MNNTPYAKLEYIIITKWLAKVEKKPIFAILN